MDGGFLSFLVSQQRNLGVNRTTHLEDRLNPHLKCLHFSAKRELRQEFLLKLSHMHSAYRECYPLCAGSKAEVKRTKTLTDPT